MIKMQLIELAQNPKVGMVAGGIMTSTGVVVNKFELVRQLS